MKKGRRRISGGFGRVQRSTPAHHVPAKEVCMHASGAGAAPEFPVPPRFAIRVTPPVSWGYLRLVNTDSESSEQTRAVVSFWKTKCLNIQGYLCPYARHQLMVMYSKQRRRDRERARGKGKARQRRGKECQAQQDLRIAET